MAKTIYFCTFAAKYRHIMIGRKIEQELLQEAIDKDRAQFIGRQVEVQAYRPVLPVLFETCEGQPRINYILAVNIQLSRYVGLVG